jgi:hypothetical protein
MCAQCAAGGAVVATAAAAGGRVWLFHVAPAWLGANARKAVSAAVIIGGVVAAGLLA